jgi:hypothetical protein
MAGRLGKSLSESARVTLTNSSMPGLVKIRITESNVEDRIKGLDTTSVPVPFECFYAAQITDAVCKWRATLDEDENYVYAIAL